MMAMRAILTGLGAVYLAGCATVAGDQRQAGGTIRTAAGEERGTIRLNPQGDTGAQLAVVASGMPPGTYGIHLHAVGRCEGPLFTSAGAHWNPTGRQHGRLNPQGSHHGDLPNLVIGADGRGVVRAGMAGALYGQAGLLDADGAALVIHARPDDELTDPTGNSGDRIACAVIAPL